MKTISGRRSTRKRRRSSPRRSNCKHWDDCGCFRDWDHNSCGWHNDWDDDNCGCNDSCGCNDGCNNSWGWGGNWGWGWDRNGCQVGTNPVVGTRPTIKITLPSGNCGCGPHPFPPFPPFPPCPPFPPFPGQPMGFGEDNGIPGNMAACGMNMGMNTGMNIPMNMGMNMGMNMPMNMGMNMSRCTMPMVEGVSINGMTLESMANNTSFALGGTNFTNP